MKIENIINSQNEYVDKNGLRPLLNDQSKGDRFKDILEKSIALKVNNENSIKKADKKVVDKKLMDVCLQMESIFVSRMLKEMRDTVPKAKLIDGGFAEKIFEVASQILC